MGDMGDMGDMEELSPRQPISPSPYSTRYSTENSPCLLKYLGRLIYYLFIFEPVNRPY